MSSHVSSHRRPSVLIAIWNLFSLLSSILGLASAADNFIWWRGHIEVAIHAYKRLAYPLFHLLFSWVPFKVPPNVFDYLILGSLVTVSHIRALFASDQVWGQDFGVIPGYYWGESPLKVIGGLVGRLLFWPIVAVYYLVKFFRGFNAPSSADRWREYYTRHPPKGRTLDESIDMMLRYERAEQVESRRFLLWLILTVLGFLVLRTWNQYL